MRKSRSSTSKAARTKKLPSAKTVSSPKNPKVQIILERLAMSGSEYPNVYWIGRKAMRLTFLSQQQRALNLIWGLHTDGKLLPKTKVTVVGAGIAGLTAAFAANQLGASVTILDAKRVPLHLQRGCQLRFVHPNILDWPDPVSANSYTNLPCMNWGADMAAQVSNTLLEQWKRVEGQIKTYYGHELRELRTSNDGRPMIFAEGSHGNYEDSCDCLILAIGFGLEKSLQSVPFLSYWENDNFGRPLITGSIPRRYLVTGCGDGGLIDAIRLRINAFDHAEFVYRLSSMKDLASVKEQLPEIDLRIASKLNKDKQIRSRIDRQIFDAQTKVGVNFDETRMRSSLEDEIAGELLEQEYRNLKIPDSLVEQIKSQLREDTVVYLNSPHSSPLSLKASILNRFVVFLLRQRGGLRYRAGDVEIAPSAPNEPFTIRFVRKHFPLDQLEVDEVVVRHGPVPVINHLFPKHIVEECRPSSSDLDDPTREAQYPRQFLTESSNELIEWNKKAKIDYAINNMPLAASERFSESRFDRFGVEVIDDHVTYFFRSLSSEELESSSLPSSFNSIPLQYEPPVEVTDKVIPKVQLSSIFGTPIVCGIGIRNINHDSNGTLGCFVRLKSSGEIAILTAASTFGNPKEVQTGDFITRSGPGVPIDPIAGVHTISSLKASSPRSSIAAGTVQFNEFQAAIATLLPHIEYETGFGPTNTFLSKLKLQLRKSSEFDERSLIGLSVCKVGVGTGLTFGRIENVLTTASVLAWEELYWFRGLLSISGLGGIGSVAFSGTGDSGAIVFTEDGYVLGLIIGRTRDITYACPIETILSAFDCELVS